MPHPTPTLPVGIQDEARKVLKEALSLKHKCINWSLPFFFFQFRAYRRKSTETLIHWIVKKTRKCTWFREHPYATEKAVSATATNRSKNLTEDTPPGQVGRTAWCLSWPRSTALWLQVQRKFIKEEIKTGRMGPGRIGLALELEAWQIRRIWRREEWPI